MATLDPTEAEDEPRRLIARRLAVQSFPVAPSDYPRIRVGEKREYRSYRLRRVPMREGECAVVYAQAGRRRPFRTALVVVEACYVEPLGAISEESVLLEGYQTFREFRTYFRERETARGFRQLDKVQVIRFRPYRPEERADLAERLFDAQYGRWE